MYLYFIKILFVCFMCGSCKGLEFNEKGTEFVKTNKTESFMPRENALSELLQQQPVAVVVELKAPLLEKVAAILEDESETNFPVKKMTLATFDSNGVQDISVYNETFEIREAIMALEQAIGEREMLTPTIHVLGDLLQRDLQEGFVLLLTMSKPSDEHFAQNLFRSFTGNKLRLSVLWAGNYPSNDYSLLKDLSEKTGGRFGLLTNDSDTEEKSIEQYFPKAEFENLSEQIKFPEEQRDMPGEEAQLASRAAENQRVIQKTVVPLIVEIASGTSLEARPGTPTQIQFQVKNNINVALPVIFNAKFNGIVQNVQPHQTLLQPSGTVTVIVNLQPIGAPQNANAIGTLTLLAIAANKVTARSALIFMTPQTVTDNTGPKMYHKYEGDCSNYREPQNCENGHWSLEATVQDEESGLLKILSEPYGLLFQSEFVAGTKTPVTVYYSATCCQPNTIIWAEDLRGNYVKKTFDVFNQNLLGGEIASIVLGVLLLVFVIIAIIVAVIIVKRRNQRNMIIPRARSSSR